MKVLIFALALSSILSQTIPTILPHLLPILRRCVRVGVLCVPANIASIIRPFSPNPAVVKCLKGVPCFRQRNGECAWLLSKRYYQCLNLNTPICVRAGCSGELCVEESQAYTTASP